MTVLGYWPFLVIRSTDIMIGSGFALLWSILGIQPSSEGRSTSLQQKGWRILCLAGTGSIFKENDPSFWVFVPSFRLSQYSEVFEVVVRDKTALTIGLS